MSNGSLFAQRSRSRVIRLWRIRELIKLSVWQKSNVREAAVKFVAICLIVLTGSLILHNSFWAKGTVIVAACHNRQENLRLSLDSWFAVKGVDQIILVDWNSSPPYADVFRDQLQGSTGIRILRIDARVDFISTWAYNMALEMTPARSRILKVDCDTIVSSEFLEYHPLVDTAFYVGGADGVRDENEANLGGFLFASSTAFRKVGGYDERIQRHGGMATDMVSRLKSVGLEQRAADLNYIHHLYHAPGGQDGYEPTRTACATVDTALTSLLLQHVSTWNHGMHRKFYDIGMDRLHSGIRVHTIIIHENRLPPSLSQLVDEQTYSKAVQSASFEELYHVVGFNTTSKLALLKSDYILHMADTYCRAHQISYSKKTLTAHLMHGMGNRLRALASAFVLARKSGRWLRVICENDIHFAAELAHLYDLQQSGILDVWDHFDPNELNVMAFDTFDYMDPEQKYAYIDGWSANHIYVRSAYRLNSSMLTPEEEDEALRNFIPSPQVQSLVASVPLPTDSKLVGVHVRHLDPAVELPGLNHSAYPDDGWNQLVKSRSQSDVATFHAEMVRHQAQDPNTTFFVAADEEDAIGQLGVDVRNVYTLERGNCSDRSPMCLQYALADLILLGRSSELLGSHWSSFSEMAGCMAGVSPQYAGQDFF